jgi:Fe-S-cluster-containing dehydrogenase component
MRTCNDGRPDPSAFELDRRAALKMLAGGTALALVSCGKPDEEIVPYVEMPERVVPGVALRFATALPLAGYARGVLVTSVEGRPIKVEGNPRHPASLGSSDVFAEASILSLYDPDRSRAVRARNGIVSWEAFARALRDQLELERPSHGSGLRILTGRITSPTLRRQMSDLLTAYPEAKWYRYEPVNDDAALAGGVQAFGRPLLALPRFADAKVVVTLDADPLGPGPQQIKLARDFIGARQTPAQLQEFLRLYAIEPVWSLSGANSDHRLALRPQLVRNAALAIANELGANLAAGELPGDAQRFVQVAAADLKSRRGQAVVLAGPAQPPEVHALCHWINGELHAPIDFVEPVDTTAPGHAESLRTLAGEIAERKVHTLIVVGANPAYDTPGELQLAEAVGTVAFSAHLGPYEDETAARCKWHLPLTHPLESWSDLRSYEGTASIVQPLIRPLYDTRTAHQLIAYLTGAVSASSYELVKQTWQPRTSGDFTSWWRQSLHNGVIVDSVQQSVAPPPAKLSALPPAPAGNAVTLVLAPDPRIWDGSFANNALLQECPDPLTKQVWGNALHISAEDAHLLGVVDGDVVRVANASAAVDAPVIVRPGQAEHVLGVTLGYGRRRAGAIGNGIGFDAYRLTKVDSPWIIEQPMLTRTGRRQDLCTTQKQFRLEGEAAELMPILSLLELQRGHGLPQLSPSSTLPTLYPPHRYDTYAWAMVIDTAACIGCNACVVACQAENNVPVVGPDEVRTGRDMHWLRIDSYMVESESAPPGFQPVPCMHCEQAPCEPVCPVMASIHDGEGLNVQVYNRCVGTRFCQSNCPYKVRRFNFFGYADGQEYANLGAEVLKAQFNPDVTVRSRGVMEKCTYCVQRISRARRGAEKEDRRIRDGEVVTACQAACPTRAIHFGDLSDPDSQVNTLRKQSRHYALLGHLGTRPRTTYLARLRNPNPALDEVKG